MNKLKHLAIIMDGNGRWAKKRGLLRTKGHENGVKALREICEFCCEKNIKILSLYAFSTENWKRPKKEIDFILNLLNNFLIQEEENLIKNKIKFNTIGDINVFSDEIKDKLNNLKEKTKNFKKLKLNLGINYGAKSEILRSCQRILDNNQELNEKNLIENLDEPTDIDLLIRSGGEKRLSNFMLLQASYAELSFSDTLFPDFSKLELEKIVNEFKAKNRSFGGVKDDE